MIHPLKNTAARVTSSFGMRKHPVTGDVKLHNGTDFGVPEGTPIYSPAGGTVTSELTNNTGGNQLLITHDNGIKTGYAHLATRLVRKGARVRPGQKIALSGNTGASTGAHLHFTMRGADGNYIDPETVTWKEDKGGGALPWIVGAAAVLGGIYLYRRYA